MNERPWRNGDLGYGIVTRVLHWVVFVLITTQFVVGHLLDADGSGRGRGRGRGRGGESGRGRGRGRGGDYEVFGDDALLDVHVVLGLAILAAVTVRLLWRLLTPLPLWADALSRRERTFVHWNERLLYLMMFAIPITGLWLVASDDDNILVAHVATHIVFYVAVGAHLALVFWHQFIRGDGLVRRMV